MKLVDNKLLASKNKIKKLKKNEEKICIHNTWSNLLRQRGPWLAGVRYLRWLRMEMKWNQKIHQTLFRHHEGDRGNFLFCAHPALWFQLEWVGEAGPRWAGRFEAPWSWESKCIQLRSLMGWTVYSARDWSGRLRLTTALRMLFAQVLASCYFATSEEKKQ